MPAKGRQARPVSSNVRPKSLGASKGKAPKRKTQQRSQQRAQNAFNISTADSDADSAEDSDQGQVKEEDDEEIDSDEAFESGDEERFSGFKFTGSLKKNGTPKSVLDKSLKKEARQATKKVTFARREIDLNEDSDEGGAVMQNEAAEASDESDQVAAKPSDDDSGESASDFEDDGGEDLMDLSEMLGGNAASDSDSSAFEDEQEATADSDSADALREDLQSELSDDSEAASNEDEEDGDALEAFIAQLDKKRQAESEPTPASKKRTKREFAEVNEPNAASEHNATTTSKLTLDDLLGGLGDKQAASLAQADALRAPLAKPIQDRIDRAAAYETVKEQITQWQPAVRQLREASVLKFPLQEPAKPVRNTNTLAADFKPSNTLEREVEQILKDSGMRSEKQVAAFEDLAMAKLSVEEVAARRAELAVMRDLMFRQEIKAKRQSKIKSKSYRRIQRKEREKLQLTQETDGRQAEEQRARERMELRHKNTGSWAQKMLGRANHDEGSRQAITEQLQRGEDLTRKVQGEDSAESADEVEQDEEMAPLPNKGVFAMKFMRDADANEARGLDHDDEEGSDAAPGAVERNAGRRRFVPAAEVQAPAEAEPTSEGDSDTQRVIRRQAVPTAIPSKSTASDEQDENPWLTTTTRRSKSHAADENDDDAVKFAAKLTKAKRATQSARHAGNMKPALDMTKVLTLGENDQVALQRDLVAQAFAGDDVVADFAAEKEAVEQADAPQEIDETLPGWGSWTGADIKRKPKKRFVRKVEGLDVAARKDQGLAHVVINEKRMKLAKPLMTAAVPFPFATKEQYERSLQMPVGKEWATRSTFQKTTMPKVVVKQGAVIAPMRRPFS